MRKLTVTAHITKAAAKAVFEKALFENKELKDVVVGKYTVVFVDVANDLAVACIQITGDKANSDSLAFCFVDKLAKPTDEVCSLCDGTGTTQTGITESPTTICERCDGHGVSKA